MGAVTKHFLSEQSCEWGGAYYNALCTPEQCYVACQEQLRTFSGMFPSELKRQKVNKREFYLVTKEAMADIRKGRPEFKSVKDTLKLHAVRSTGTAGIIDTKFMLCACAACYNSDPAPIADEGTHAVFIACRFQGFSRGEGRGGHVPTASYT